MSAGDCHEIGSLVSRCTLSAVGFGGAGHTVQQLAHVVIQQLRFLWDAIVEGSNLNRPTGAMSADVLAECPILGVAG